MGHVKALLTSLDLKREQKLNDKNVSKNILMCYHVIALSKTFLEETPASPSRVAAQAREMELLLEPAKAKLAVFSGFNKIKTLFYIMCTAPERLQAAIIKSEERPYKAWQRCKSKCNKLVKARINEN